MSKFCQIWHFDNKTNHFEPLCACSMKHTLKFAKLKPTNQQQFLTIQNTSYKYICTLFYKNINIIFNVLCTIKILIPCYQSVLLNVQRSGSLPFDVVSPKNGATSFYQIHFHLPTRHTYYHLKVLADRQSNSSVMEEIPTKIIHKNKQKEDRSPLDLQLCLYMSPPMTKLRIIFKKNH